MTTATETTAIISSKSRNLGYGWTNQPERYTQPNGDNGLRVTSVDTPDVQGGLRSVLAEREHCRRLNETSHYNEALFVGGQLFTGYRDEIDQGGVYDIQWGEDDPSLDPDVTFVPNGWMRADVGDILSRLANGEQIEVRIA